MRGLGSKSSAATRRVRQGFSLIELLVALAILATLLGLLLPAVQRVRHAAARITCAAKLGQIGLAASNYHTTFGAFPPGVSTDPGRRHLTWNAHLLPYLDNEPLWREVEAAFERDPNFLRPPHDKRRATPVPAFACPMDGRAMMPSTKLGDLRVAFTSYVGVAGTTCQRGDGVYFVGSGIRQTDVTDGASNTVAIGERPPSADESLGWWYAGWGRDGYGSVETVLGSRQLNPWDAPCFAGPYRFGAGRFDNQCDVYHFWSPHPGGANFVFVDGSCRFIAYSAHVLLTAMSTRAGAEGDSPP